MEIKFLEQPGRTHCGFISKNADAFNRQRNKKVGVPQRIMVKEVVRTSAEMIKVKHPATERNSQTNVMLLVALAAQRQKSLVGRDGREHVTGNSIQRRRLIITA